MLPTVCGRHDIHYLWLVTAVGSMALARAFAKCGMFVWKSGAGCQTPAFGKSGNFMANYTPTISLLIANVAIAISAVGYGTELFKRRAARSRIGLALSPCVGLMHRKLWRRACYRTDQWRYRLRRYHSGCRYNAVVAGSGLAPAICGSVMGRTHVPFL